MILKRALENHPKAQEVYTKYACQTPFKIVEFANELGLSIFEDDSMEISISGKIECSNKENCEIIVNANHSNTRKIFTIAHEVGHYLLHAQNEDHYHHKSPVKSWARSQDGIGSDQLQEIEANAFAAEILMPEDKFLELWNNPDYHISDIAKEFGVSSLASQYRAMNLGLLEI